MSCRAHLVQLQPGAFQSCLSFLRMFNTFELLPLSVCACSLAGARMAFRIFAILAAILAYLLQSHRLLSAVVVTVNISEGG